MLHTFTTYYVTFQVASGDRMELTVSGSDYGMLVEGDIGTVSYTHLFSGTTQVSGQTMYSAEDRDIRGAEQDYKKLEKELDKKIDVYKRQDRYTGGQHRTASRHQTI